MNIDLSASAWAEAWKILSNSLLQGIWETVYVSLIATLISFVIGIPLGVLLVTGGKNGIAPLPKWLMAIIGFIVNILRSVPFVILVVVVFPITRAIIGTTLGPVASIVPLVIAAAPYVARLVESSIREVNPNIIEAAQSMGATPMQIVWHVMLPEAFPSLVSNLTIAMTTIIAYTAMTGSVGGGGLGKIAINYGYYRFQWITMMAAVLVIVIMVEVVQDIGTHLAISCDKRLKNKGRKLE